MTGLSGKQVQIIGHISIETTCGEGIDAREIDVNYLIMDFISPYNIILGSPNTNALIMVVSTLYINLNIRFLMGEFVQFVGIYKQLTSAT